MKVQIGSYVQGFDLHGTNLNHQTGYNTPAGTCYAAPAHLGTWQ